MARTSNPSAIRKPGKSLKVKDCIFGSIRGLPTPLRQKKICSKPFACGRHNRAHGRDADLETCCRHNSKGSLGGNSTLVSHFLNPQILQPPAACMTRGQQGIHDWWLKSCSVKVLGHLRECMQAFAQHCLLSVEASYTTTLRVLSLSDGFMNDFQVVPTSVLLAHAFASLNISALPTGLERIQIFGADVQNPDVLEPQKQPWMPPWLELQHVCLDNTKNFKPQLVKCGLCPDSAKFDIVLMRQGLCYCEDHSFDCLPPEKLILAGVRGEGNVGGPSGTYILEPGLFNDRPCYRNGKFLLYWRPHRYDWVVVEDKGVNAGNVWANVCKDAGSPALAQGSWFVWDGKDFSINSGVSCRVAGSCPWRRPPQDCKCCAGFSLDAATLQGFIARVAAVLDEHNPRAFALLHGGYYKGVADEVEEFHLELETAAKWFNSSRSCMCASVLRRNDSRDTEDDPTHYWNQIDGLLLSTSRA